MTSPSLTTPPRSLAQYAEELRAEIAFLDRFSFPRLDVLNRGRADRLKARLLAVEREINWRASI